MVAAYLRGLLKPTLQYGLRSAVAENLVLEALSADRNAHDMEVSVALDSAISSIIKPEARQAHLQSIFARAGRAKELRVFNVHRLEDRWKAQNTSGEISVFQLYQLLEKKGILAAMRKHYRELDEKENSQ